jgi:hypothetical protein
MAATYPQVLVTQRQLLELTGEYLARLDQAWQAALRLQSLLAGDALDSPGREMNAADNQGDR